MKKRFIIILGIIVLVMILLETKSSAVVSINTKKIDLYAIDERQAQSYNLTIPKEYAQSYTLKVTGNKEKPVFEIIGEDGEDAINIDENGIITVPAIIFSSLFISSTASSTFVIAILSALLATIINGMFVLFI